MSLVRISVLLALFLRVSFVATYLQGMLRLRESETRQIKSLDGLWDFRVDLSNAGFDEMWYAWPLSQSGEVLSMPVPSSYNDITEERWLRDYVGWVWYERTFFVPASWRAPDRRVVLRFDSVSRRCMVWLNNDEIIHHKGGDLPFEADITRKLRILPSGAQRLTVAVSNKLTTPLKIVTQHCSAGTCHSSGNFVPEFDFAGIHGSVKLYSTPVVHLSDITLATDHSYNKAAIKLVTEVGAVIDVRKGRVIMNYELLDREGRVAASVGGVGMFSAKMTVFFPTLWWPKGMGDKPGYLYTLKVITTYRNIHDVYTLPVGFRTIRVEGSSFLINNVPFYFKGFGKRQDSDIRGRGFDYVTLVRDFNLINWFGANAIRTSEHPPPEELLELADQHGIVVIDESPSMGLWGKEDMSDHAVNRHLDALSALIQRDKNHPSVVMWSVASQPASRYQQIGKHLRRMMDYTREMDFQRRPVTYVTSLSDGTTMEKDHAHQFCDVISFDRHYGWFTYPGQPDLIPRALEEDLRALHRTHGKPVLMAEYGASAIGGKHRQPSLVYTEEYQVDTMRQYFPVFDQLRKDFLAGEMIWTFSDYNVLESFDVMSANNKGLLTRQRQPKASAHTLRQRYQTLAMDAHPRYTGDELLDVLIRFKPGGGDQSPLSIRHRLPALIREERVNSTIRKRSVDELVTLYTPH